MKKGYWVGIIILAGLCVPAFAGTTTVAFSCDTTGPLNYKASGSGTLTAVGGRGSFSGSNVTLLAQSGSPVYSSSSVSVSMMLCPYTDATNGVGLVMIDPQGEDQLRATVSPNGDVTLSGYMGYSATTHFTYPAALNNTMTLTYDPYTDTATLTVTATPPQTRSVSLPMAMGNNGSVQVGAFANGPGGFSKFTATSSSIPDYSSPAFGFVAFPGAGMKQVYDPLRLYTQVTPDSVNVSYQWYKNGTLLPGQTGAVYEVASLMVSDTGNYVCRVTDGCGVVHDTPPAVVTVLPAGSLPAVGTTGLCLLAALMMMAGVLGKAGKRMGSRTE